MSLVVTMYGEEGIVMASDSRATYYNTTEENGTKVLNYGSSQSDAMYKTFLAHGRIGISFCGTGTINGSALAGHLDAFIVERLDSNTDIDTIPDLLLEYFSAFSAQLDTCFQVCGYKLANGTLARRIFRVYMTDRSKVAESVSPPGMIWNGENDVLTRLLTDCYRPVAGQHVKYLPVPQYAVPFELFTLQDMIDFAVYAIRTTSDTMRFQMRAKTVGGPIDILVIKPTSAAWIKRKELKYNEA